MLLTRARATTALTHLSLIISLTGGWSVSAHANPEGGVVSAGSAVISSAGNKLDVHQSSDRVVIDWRSFNIDINEHTQFYQPSSGSLALNRVNSADPSVILGKLSANGNIILINPNGVMFGAGSRVDVNGLVATTADITNENFMAGRLQFDRPGNPDALILNEGHISAKEAGLVGLVAPNVINTGIIEAKLGRIHLAGGDTATVDFYGDGLMEVAVSDDVKSQLVMNTGQLAAAGGTIAMTASAGKEIVNNLVVAKGELKAPAFGMKNGKISIFAEGSNAVKNNVAADKGKKSGSSTVFVEGIFDVSGMNEGERGGSITVTGDDIAVLNGTIMNASGYSGKTGTVDGKLISDAREGSAGGDIRIGGDYLGGGDTATAQNLFVDTYTLFYNDALHDGDAGRTIFWSDNDTIFKGNVYARGGTEGGNGGFLETSGKKNLVAQGFADLTAALGHKGTYFLDPTNITIIGNFAPTDVAGLKLWLDGNDIDGDGIAEGQSEAGLVSGAGNCGAAVTCVSTWNDKALNNDATQGTAARRPVVTTSTQNGKTYVTFDGDVSSHFMTGNIGTTGTSTSVFTAALFSETNPTDYDYLINVGNGGAGTNFSIARSWNVNGGAVAKGLYSYDGGTARGSPVLPGGTWNLLGGRTNPSGDRFTFNVDGVESAATAHAGINSTNGAYSLGYYGPGSTHHLNGSIGEVLIYDGALTADQNVLIQQYQSAKWGLGLDPVAGAGSEATEAMSTNGYSVFTTRYLERLSQSADISLQASTDITFDLRGDTLALQADRNLTLTAGNDIKSATDSFGTVSTSRTGSGGNITMTAGRHLDLSNVLLKSGGGDISLTGTAGDVTLPAINSGTGSVDINGQNVYINTNQHYRTSNMVGYWNFNEGTGTTAGDSSGNNNNGTLINGVTWSTDVPTGTSDNTGSLSFNGTSGYVQIADANSLDISAGFTMSTWVKSNGAQSSRYLISKLYGGGTDNVYAMLYGYSPNQVQFYSSANAYGYSSANSNMALDTGWHHMTYTYDGTTFKGYRDGMLVNSMNLASNIATSVGALFLGSFNGAGYFLNGLMDDVRIYNAALSASEVARLAIAPPTWQTGNTSINATNNIGLNLNGQTMNIGSGSSLSMTAGQGISSSSAGLIQTATGAGNMSLTAGTDINFAHDLDLNATGTGSVTLRSGNSIIYSGSGDITTQGGGITLNSDYHATTPNSLGAIALGSGTNIASNNGNILMGGGTNGTGYAYGTAVDAAGINLNGATVSSGTGTLTLRGNGYTGGSIANEHGVWIQGSAGALQTTTGAISVYGRGGVGTTAGHDGWGNLGVYVLNSGVTSNSGNILIDGLGGTGNMQWNVGTAIYTGSSVRTAGGGTIDITGINNSAANVNQVGVWLGSSNGYVEAHNGAITINATSTRAATGSYGLYVNTSANGIRTTGSGNITVTGTATASAQDIYYGAAFAFGSGTATGDITINANNHNFAVAPTFTTTGTVTFAPRTTGTTVGVAGGAGDMGITAAVLNNISAGTVAFGRTDGTALLTVGARDWGAGNYNVRLLNGTGRIAFASGTTAMGNRTLFAQTDEYVRMQSGSTITSTAVGNAVTLVGGTGFTNMSGSATPITVTGGGRWLIYTASPAADTLNGMTYDFRRFTCTYGGACPTLGTGNGMMHQNTPVLTVSPSSTEINFGDAVPSFTYGVTGYLGSDAGLDGLTGAPSYSTNYTQGDAAGTYDITGTIGTLASAMGYGFTFNANNGGLTVKQPAGSGAATNTPTIPNSVLVTSQIGTYDSFSGPSSTETMMGTTQDEKKDFADLDDMQKRSTFRQILNGLLSIDPELEELLRF